MSHELTITVDDDVYQTLKPMVEQQTITSLLHEFLYKYAIEPSARERSIPAIATLRGTLHQVDTSDIRDEADRSL
jgi:predicted CopG family antitoxin